MVSGLSNPSIPIYYTNLRKERFLRVHYTEPIIRALVTCPFRRSLLISLLLEHNKIEPLSKPYHRRILHVLPSYDVRMFRTKIGYFEFGVYAIYRYVKHFSSNFAIVYNISRALRRSQPGQ